MHATLNGRHAVVTGASRGIGLAIARALSAAGARLTLMARGEAGLLAARDGWPGPGAPAIEPLDVGDRPAIGPAFERAQARQGAIDILVNNAGQGLAASFNDMAEQDWEHMLAVNLSSAFYCTRAVLPGMQARGWGRIVNVASTAGLTGYRGVTAYCAAKHGLVGLTRALALEVARQGITVNAVCPGYTDTALAQAAVARISAQARISGQQARQRLLARNPQGRLVQPDEVAQVVCWLCQPGASAVNGQALAVDGGEVMTG